MWRNKEGNGPIKKNLSWNEGLNNGVLREGKNFQFFGRGRVAGGLLRFSEIDHRIFPWRIWQGSIYRFPLPSFRFLKKIFWYCSLVFPSFLPFLHIFHYCNFNFPLSLSSFVLFLSHYYLFSLTQSFSTVGIGRYFPGGGSIFGHIDTPLFNSSCNWASKYSEAWSALQITVSGSASADCSCL